MLTRIYLDNFRSFVNFEHRFDQSQRHLIFGGNGTGKSSLLIVLDFLRRAATLGDALMNYRITAESTRWDTRPRQTAEIEARIDGGRFTYRLVLEAGGDPPKARIVEETVHRDGRPIFEFLRGEVHLHNDRSERKVTYPYDPYRPALATITEPRDNASLVTFKKWLNSLYIFQLNPFLMASKAESEHYGPSIDLSNVAAWYRHVVQSQPKRNALFLAGLRDILEGLDSLRFVPGAENTATLLADFLWGNRQATFAFSQLSEGQKCLICLYAILHFLVDDGSTVFIDEPDNFIALREIQPWLNAVADTTDSGKGQVFIISHHPEILNQWAPSHGIELVREEGGPTRAVDFRPSSSDLLSPAELIARGWERE